MTHALQCVSPAIDKGSAFSIFNDQRGGTRPFDLADSVYPNAAGGDGSDIGAFEVQTGGGCLPLAVPPAVVNPSNSGVSVGDGVTGGSGVFATAISTTDPTNVLRVKVKFGVVRSGRFILLLIPMAKTSPTP